jgi:hypothetical protein
MGRNLMWLSIALIFFGSVVLGVGFVRLLVFTGP